MANISLIVPLIMISVMVLVFILNRHFEKKRQKAIEEVALKRGFLFTPLGDRELELDLSLFQILNKGYNKSIRNVIKGSTKGIPITIFDFSYVTGHGKNSSTIRFTAGITRLNKSVPFFILEQESFLTKIAETFTKIKDIDFPEHQTFSDKYFLQSSEEEAVRKMFTTGIISHFENSEFKGCIETSGNRIMISPLGAKRVKPENYDQFIQDIISIGNLFNRELENR